MTASDSAPPPGNGDHAAQVEREVRELHALHAAPLHRYAGALARDQEMAADAVQEVFLRYFIERTYGRQIDNPRCWLFRVIRNQVLDTLKAAGNRCDVGVEEVERLPDAQQDPEAGLRRQESARSVAKMLSPREWQCLSLRFEGLAYEEIGEAMGLCSGTVGALLARALVKLRRAARASAGADAIRFFGTREGHA